MPPTLNERLAQPWTDELQLSALARRLLRPEQRAMRFDAYDREAPLEEQMLSPHDIEEMERAQLGGIAVRLLPPKVMYHGSTGRGYGLMRLQSGQRPIPAWFSEEKKLAQVYADTRGPRGIYRPLHPVPLEQPLILTQDMNKTASIKQVRKDSGLDFPLPPRFRSEDARAQRWEIVNSPEFVAAAKAAGYDGIRVTEGGTMTWGVFEPTWAREMGARAPKAPLPPPEPSPYRRWLSPAQMQLPETVGRGQTVDPPWTPPPPVTEGRYMRGGVF